MRVVLESDPELVEFFLKIILKDNNLKVEEISYQEDMKNLVGRSTTLDCYGKLSDGSFLTLNLNVQIIALQSTDPYIMKV